MVRSIDLQLPLSVMYDTANEELSTLERPGAKHDHSHSYRQEPLESFLLLIIAQCMRPADIKDVALVSTKLDKSKQSALRQLFEQLSASAWTLALQLEEPSSQPLHLSLRAETHKSNGVACSLSQYITKHSRTMVQELCDGMAMHCATSVRCQALLSWMVSKDALAHFYDVDDINVRTSAEFQRKILVEFAWKAPLVSELPTVRRILRSLGRQVVWSSSR
eukprot:TRINITY_DN12687_c1_g1_i1.p1 TRINITY_DN12687_c1_g1~~TRINITY_DN12687_c1_g1_i1.p1  ORF type:complete len:220 (+),score=34.09 TRINITY_DN12687_c1_g1_i1:135-794(+)